MTAARFMKSKEWWHIGKINWKNQMVCLQNFYNAVFHWETSFYVITRLSLSLFSPQRRSFCLYVDNKIMHIECWFINSKTKRRSHLSLDFESRSLFSCALYCLDTWCMCVCIWFCSFFSVFPSLRIFENVIVIPVSSSSAMIFFFSFAGYDFFERHFTKTNKQIKQKQKKVEKACPFRVWWIDIHKL